MVGVAQLVERRSVAAEVFTGSSPVAHPLFNNFLYLKIFVSLIYA